MQGEGDGTVAKWSRPEVRRDKLYGAADLLRPATIASVIAGRKCIMSERGQSYQVYLLSDRLIV